MNLLKCFPLCHRHRFSLHFSISDNTVCRLFIAQHRQAVFGRHASHGCRSVIGMCSHVWRDDYSRISEQRIGGKWRFISQDIERCSLQFAIVEGLFECSFVHKFTPCCIDEKGSSLHDSEESCIHHATRFRSRRQVQRNDVAHSQNLVHILQFNAICCCEFSVGKGIIRHNVEFEPLQPERKLASHSTKTDDTERLPLQGNAS